MTQRYHLTRLASAATATLFAALAVASAAPAAHAQYGTARILRPRLETGTEAPLLSHLSLGPAVFLGVDSSLGTVRTVGAGVLAVETALPLHGSAGKSAAQVGGFIYNRGNSSLYQVQGKYYLNRSFGVQAGYQQGSNSSSGHGLTAYGLYNLSSSVLDPTAKIHWDIQFGLGGLRAAETDQSEKTSLAGFAQFSVQLTRRISLDTSYWGIAPARNSSINRLFAGVGVNF